MPIKKLLGIFCIAESAYYLMQNMCLMPRDEFNAAGHFDSIAGLTICLSVCVPVFLHGFQRSNTPSRIFMGISFLACVLTVILSKSRIGTIYVVVCIMLMFFKGKRQRIALAWVAVTLVVLSAFLIKTDSSEGRLFILSQTFMLIMRKPLCGWGMNGFESQYMNVQADYFAAHPQSPFAMLADNVRHPLNEFLYVASNYGVIVLFILCACICLVCLYYKKNRTEDGKLGMEILTGILVFSLFSYPFHYLFVWVMLIFALYLVFVNLITEKQVGRWVIGGSVLLLLALGYWKVKQYYLEKEWLEVEENSRYKSFRTILLEYQRLYAKMPDNSHFLYNYAFVLREAGRYDEALKIAKECNLCLADYDLSLLLGDINSDLRKDEEAVSYYTLAHNMCPNRFAPLCAIYDIYKSQGNREKCMNLIKEILDKPIKVPSRATMEYVDYIRSEAKKYNL